MRLRGWLCSVGLTTALVFAADQAKPGAGNGRAEEIAGSSPFVRAVLAELTRNAQAIKDPKLRNETLDGLTNPKTCIVHRAHVTDQTKSEIISQLVAAHLLNEKDAQMFEGGAMAGVFPPVLDDGSDCPHTAIRFAATPGSGSGSHHSFPGGLAVHEGFNQRNAKALAELYGQMFGEGVRQAIDTDVVLAAPVWHDWGKMLVFQWNADGTEFKELDFGGTGSNDNYGKAGDSRTGAHHIISLAETMSRGLSPLLVIAQACSHSAPTLGNEYKVVNWLLAASILARIDPVAKGYLTKGPDGRLSLPPLRHVGDGLDLPKEGQPNMLIEYQIHHLSDGDYVNSVPAAHLADLLLEKISAQFGYDPGADRARYNNQFRNVALAFTGAERLELLYESSGLTGVTAEIRKLRDKHVL